MKRLALVVSLILLVALLVTNTFAASPPTPLEALEKTQTALTAAQAQVTTAQREVASAIQTLKQPPAETPAEREAREKTEREARERVEREAREKAKREQKEREGTPSPTIGAGTIRTRLDAKSAFDSFPVEWFKRLSRVLAYPTAGDRYTHTLPTLAYHDAWTTWGSSGATHIAEYVALAKRDQSAGYVGQFMDDVNFAGGNIAGTRAQYANLIEAVRAAIGPSGVIEINAQFWNIWPLIQKSDPDVLRALSFVNVVTKEFNVDPIAGINSAAKYGELVQYADFLAAKGIHITLTGDSKYNTSADKEYSLATYLLINDAGGDFIGFSEQGPGKEYAGLTLNLGDATSAREHSGSVWKRTFTGGAAYVVEPGAATQTIQLPKAMKNLEGQTVTQVTVTAAHGAVLRD